MIMIYLGHLLNAGLSGEQSKGAAALVGILKESSETNCELPTIGQFEPSLPAIPVACTAFAQKCVHLWKCRD